MKKLAIAILLALAAVLGFSNASWAADRPNTPECADVNGRSDPDACHIQYIEPLQKELEEMWFQLVKLQGKKAEDNPWVFKTDNSACNQDKPEYYDEKLCKLSMPGKLAQAKYLIHEEVKGLAYQAKVKRQKAQLAQELDAAKKELAEKDKELAEVKKENAKLNVEKASLVEALEKSITATESKKRADITLFIVAFTLIMILAVVVFARRTVKENKP